MSPLRGIVFDKDGTLFDFDATWAAWTAAIIDAEAGGDRALRDRLDAALGFDRARTRFRRDSIVIAEPTRTVAERVLAVTGGGDVEALMARMAAAARTAPQVPVAPLAPLFDDLAARGLTLGLVTNDTEGPARTHLAREGIEGRFTFVAGSDSGHGAKPDPGQLQAFCAATGLAPRECVMVGDSTHDLRAGRAAGMRCLGVLTGPARREDLTPLADRVLGSIAELPEWLDSAV